jgi:MFS family permease
MTAITPHRRTLWIMLTCLGLGFTVSQGYRSVAALMAPAVQNEFGLLASDLGLFAASFHFAFGLPQILMGIGIDRYGIRRTVLFAMPLTIVGAVLSFLAPSFAWLVVAQVLIGMGCAPAFLVCTVFIAKRFRPQEFAAVSGLVLGVGGVGMLFTGSPLAWLIEHDSWRAGFVVLGIGSVFAMAAIYWQVQEEKNNPEPNQGQHTLPAGYPTRAEIWSEFKALILAPQTLGILLLGSMTYASFMTLRGLWLGPMLMQQLDFSLSEAGQVALAFSVLGLFSPPFFGRVSVHGLNRRRLIVQATVGTAVGYLVLAVSPSAWVSVVTCFLIALSGGYMVLQYADVRASYTPQQIGRAMALFTMSMFLGVAFMQGITGAVASWAQSQGWPIYRSVNLAIAVLLLIGALAFQRLPRAASMIAERSA